MSLRVIDPYQVLGVTRDSAPAAVRDAWLARVREYQPGAVFDGNTDEYEGAMRAYLAIKQVPETILSAGQDGLPDWASVFVYEEFWRGAALRQEEYRLDRNAMDGIAEALKPLPSYLEGSRLFTVPHCDVRTYIDHQLGLQEMRVRALRDVRRFDMVWRTRLWKSKGQHVLGSCSVIPLKEREMWSRGGIVPYWRLTLSLPYWLLASDIERYRLIHHELCHAELVEEELPDGELVPKPTATGHDMEEHLSTLARFGARDVEQAALLFAAIMHPRTRQIAQDERWDPRTGQGIMFPPVRQRQFPPGLEEVQLFAEGDPIDAYERFLCQ